MDWLWLALSSAWLLGFYEIAKKLSLRDNAVLGVLCASSWCGFALVLGASLLFAGFPGWSARQGLVLAPLEPLDHLRVLGKALLVSSSWVATFFALKHLPLSLAGPLRASSPLYTWLAAVLWFGERPSPTQWLGMALVLGAYVAFSKLGRRDDVALLRSRWAVLLLVGTLLGAASSLYDKHLLGPHVALAPWALGVWFTAYHTLVLTAVAAVAWWPTRRHTTPFEWRLSIPAIALLLLVADQLYFRALAAPDSLVAVVAMLRRASVLVSFVIGGLWLRERHLRQKGWALGALVVGVVLLLR